MSATERATERVKLRARVKALQEQLTACEQERDRLEEMRSVDASLLLTHIERIKELEASRAYRRDKQQVMDALATDAGLPILERLRANETQLAALKIAADDVLRSHEVAGSHYGRSLRMAVDGATNETLTERLRAVESALPTSAAAGKYVAALEREHAAVTAMLESRKHTATGTSSPTDWNEMVEANANVNAKVRHDRDEIIRVHDEVEADRDAKRTAHERTKARNTLLEAAARAIRRCYPMLPVRLHHTTTPCGPCADCELFDALAALDAKGGDS